MNLVVATQQHSVSVNKLSAVEGARSIAHWDREATTEKRHLITARHGHQEATALLSQRWRQFQPQAVLTHEGEILGQTNQFSSTACSEIDLLLSRIEIELRFLTARQLDSSRQEIAHMN